MSVESVELALRVSRPGGQPVSSHDMGGLQLDAFGAVRPTLLADRGPWMTGLVKLFRVELAQFSGRGRHTAFAEALFKAFEDAARWMEAQPDATAEFVRRSGLEFDLLVDARIESNQLDLRLPVTFQVAAGRLGLPLVIVTND